MQTTLNKIHEEFPCDRGWNAINNYVGKNYDPDAPISFNKVLDAVGLMGAIWCLRTIEGHEDTKADFMAFCETGPRSNEDLTLKFLELFGD